MFKDKIQQLLNCLEIVDANFAAKAGVDRSLISRLKTGQRIPKPDSNSLTKIIDTIYSLALENNKLHDLYELMGQPGLQDGQSVKNKILEFLYSDIKLDDRNETHRYDNFSHRLDQVMQSLGLSNVRLAKIINIDPSLISRFRRGERTPRSNKQLMLEISNSLYSYTVKMGKAKSMFWSNLRFTAMVGGVLGLLSFGVMYML